MGLTQEVVGGLTQEVVGGLTQEVVVGGEFVVGRELWWERGGECTQTKNNCSCHTKLAGSGLKI